MRDIVLSAVNKFRQVENDFFLLDAGCGTGGVLARCDSVKACGFDISAEAISFCRMRNCNQVLQASICEIPFKNQCFDVVLSLDTLCCIDQKGNDRALTEIYRVLKPGGILILNLPAYQCLKGTHDRVVGTRHRYTTGELRQGLEKAGFSIAKITYRNMFLFPAIATKRLIDKKLPHKTKMEKSDLKAVPKVFNMLFSAILFIENIFLSHLSFPFGLSVFCIAHKKHGK